LNKFENWSIIDEVEAYEKSVLDHPVSLRGDDDDDGDNENY